MAQDFTVTEAARVLGVSRRTVERRVKAKRYPVVYEASGRRLVTIPDDELAHPKRTLARAEASQAVEVSTDAAMAERMALLEERLAAVTEERDFLRGVLRQALTEPSQVPDTDRTLSHPPDRTRPAPGRRLSAWSRVRQWWATVTATEAA